MFFEYTCRSSFPANIYLFKVNNKNTRKKVLNMFKVNTISDIFLVFLLLTLNK